MLNIGIIGTGSIGTAIAKAVEKEIPQARVIAISDMDKAAAQKLQDKLKHKPKITTTENLIETSDLVVECASKSAVPQILTQCITHKKDLLVMSISALLTLKDELEQARDENINIYAPSGAIAGIDALKAAKESEIYTVTLTTTKPKKGLAGAPYLEKNNIDIEKITEKTKLFEGNVYDATEGFPKNINVAATVSLAGIGPEKTRIIIMVDPKTDRNTHELKVTGAFGTITAKTENMPFPENPKTSYLAAISAIAKIKDIADPLKIGT